VAIFIDVVFDNAEFFVSKDTYHARRIFGISAQILEAAPS
jgi:hypothetical protein